MEEKIKEKNIIIKIGNLEFPGILAIPSKANNLVIFSHGSGSSRFSPRNTYVANILQADNIGTLALDLLTEKEDEVYENRFNIPLISNRLVEVTRWLLENPVTKGMNIGYFGASTGAAAALNAAAILQKETKAVVSRGGRPDLAMEELPKVKAPTLLIVGGVG